MNQGPCCWYCCAPAAVERAPAENAQGPSSASVDFDDASRNLSLRMALQGWKRVVVCEGCGRVLAERLIDLSAVPCTSWCGLHAWDLTRVPNTATWGSALDETEAGRREHIEAVTASESHLGSDGACTNYSKDMPCVLSQVGEPDTIAASDPAEDRLFEHFAVTPDMQFEPYTLLGRTSAPEDPYASQGFTTAASFLLPRSDAFPLVSVHKVSGALAEMERLLSFLGGPQSQLAAPAADSMDGAALASTAPAPTGTHSLPQSEESDLSEGDTEDQKQGRSTGVDEQRSASITSSAPAERRESPTASSFLDEQGSTAGDEDIAAGALLRAYVRVYFVILDVVHALGIESKPLEKELVETALAMYRVCVERISLRNRIPEAFAVACVLLASERLATRHGLRGSAAATKPVPGTVTQHTLNTSFTCPVWDPSFVKRVVAAAEPVWPQANLALTYEYMRRVLNTLLERRPDTVEAIGHEMPRYCELLGVNTQVANLAHIIAERAVIHGVCARRTSVSVCAAAIYLATHLEDARRMPNSASGKEQGSSTSAMASVGDSSRIKQRDIAEKLQLSEVTLRKAHKEFLARLDVVLPSDYRPSRFLKRCLPPSYQRVAAAALQRIASRETASPNGTKETLAGTRMDPESALSMNMTALGACATGCNPKDAFRTDMPKQTMLESRSDESSRAPAATPLSEHRIGLSADTSSCGAPARQATTAADAADESGTADGGEAHRISPVAAVTPTMRLDSATLALCLPRAIGPAALLRHWGICTLPANPGVASLRALLLQSALPSTSVDRIVQIATHGSLPLPIGLLLNFIESGIAPPLDDQSPVMTNITTADTPRSGLSEPRPLLIPPPPPPPLPARRGATPPETK